MPTVRALILFPALVISGGLVAIAADEPSGAPVPDAANALAVARGHLESGAPELAVEILVALAEREPKDTEIARFLGAALLATGRPAEALDPLRRAAREARWAAGASYDVARALAGLERADEALRWIDRAWQAGFRDIDRLRDDPAFAAFSEEDPFLRLLLEFEQSLEPFADHVRILHEFRGRAAGETYGWVGIDAGDVDGDGVHDAAISAPFARRDGARRGRVEVRSGATGDLLLELWGEPEERFGFALGRAGDVDGDGAADLVVGAPGAEGALPRQGAAPAGEAPPGAASGGRITVWSGRDGSLLAERRAQQTGAMLGAEARGIGDWDGDGALDFLAGSPGFDGPNGEDAGRVELLSGRDLEPFFTIDGARAGDRLGRAAWGEARAEGHFLVVGAGAAGPGRRGRATLYRGRDPEVLAVVEPGEDGGSLGETCVSLIGDVDADGVPDFSVSDWRHRARGRNTGRVFVHSGEDGHRLRTLTGSHGEGFGIGDGIAGDVDQDGHDDIVIGAWLSSRGASEGGAVFIISGRDGEVLASWAGRTVGDHVGFDATGLGDVDGDRVTDLLVTAASSSILGPDTGRAFILAGPHYLRRPEGWIGEDEER